MPITKSTILADEDYTMPNKWGFGNCDDVSVVLVVGKDKRVKYYKKGPVRGAEIKKVIKICEDEINKSTASTTPPASPPTSK